MMAENETDLRALLQERYGQEAAEIEAAEIEAAEIEAAEIEVPEITGETNEVLRALLSHKSVRRYRSEPLPPGMLEQLVAAGQSAASSSNLQTWSVVALEQPDHKSDAATLCGDQEFIRQAPLFLVFCADLSRLTFISEQLALPGTGLDYFEMFLMAAIDATLAAQNVAVAAEAAGLGICYVGAARNRPRELAALLKLPPRVFALFGMAVGWPGEEATAIKPRLPQSEVLYRETYDAAAREEWIARYDDIMSAFAQSQGMEASGTWSGKSARRVATVEGLNGRHLLREILQEHGFDLR
jgi:nitroreductase